jgi:hypothetical protein
VLDMRSTPSFGKCLILSNGLAVTLARNRTILAQRTTVPNGGRVVNGDGDVKRPKPRAMFPGEGNIEIYPGACVHDRSIALVALVREICSRRVIELVRPGGHVWRTDTLHLRLATKAEQRKFVRELREYKHGTRKA